jgi:hypothetical protein
VALGVFCVDDEVAGCVLCVVDSAMRVCSSTVCCCAVVPCEDVVACEGVWSPAQLAPARAVSTAAVRILDAWLRMMTLLNHGGYAGEEARSR